MTQSPAGTVDDGLRPRQCGRCRLFFEGDPTGTTGPTGPQDWWLCPACRVSLLPGRPTRAEDHGARVVAGGTP